jgi:hypothetical protein
MDGYMSVGLVKRADGQWELANAIDALIWQSDGTTVPKAILTLGDLKKNADVVQGGRATINVEYSAINGLRYKHSIDVDLPEFIAYYQFKPEKYSAVKPTCAAPAPTDAMFFLAAALHPPTINAESADHTITLESEFNMKDVGLGESREESLAVDKRLSPRGTVNWEILLKDPAGGTYELTFVVNDMPVGVSRVHCFRAERLGYHTEEHEIIDECLNRAPPAVAPAPPAP